MTVLSVDKDRVPWVDPCREHAENERRMSKISHLALVFFIVRLMSPVKASGKRFLSNNPLETISDSPGPINFFLDAAEFSKFYEHEKALK